MAHEWRTAEFTDTFGTNMVANESRQIVSLNWDFDPNTFSYLSKIWLDDPLEGLNVAVAAGDVVEVAAGDFRELSGVSFVPQGFNEAGQIVFIGAFYNRFTFKTTYGVFKASAANAVGETSVSVPGTTLLTLLGMGCLMLARCRQRVKTGRGYGVTHFPFCRKRLKCSAI